VSVLSSSKGGSSLAGLKTFRILRPLRVANRLPSLKRVITAMLASLPQVRSGLTVRGTRNSTKNEARAFGQHIWDYPPTSAYFKGRVIAAMVASLPRA